MKSTIISRGQERAPIRRISVSLYRVTTDFPEADGTISWDVTNLVVVEATAGDFTGLGYTYADAATAELIRDKLTKEVEGRNAFDIPGSWLAMVKSIRNLGRPGIASMAISAVDIALWDLKARVLGVPLVDLLGRVRDSVPVYGSGGFTSYPIAKLQQQLAGWVEQGIPRVKMKIGSDPSADVARVRAAREAIGPGAELFVDANGAYSRKQALYQADAFTQFDVTWFEEPVTSDDLEGLRLIRDRAPVRMEIAAGEYGYDSWYFRRMLSAEAVDVLQADATRCAGITGFLQASALCQAHHLPLSAHTAPSVHMHVGCAAIPLRHLEYFHDHVRIESMFFEGLPKPVNGALRPDSARPGMGIEFKRADAARFAA
ncbi:MAG TPA: enolase C-terminal domain-like protein [Candidatus Acidoferrales bacterium]|nr:enolase C-terminal domain-like protein [Candidatus Acidoferrales bacterium]